MSNTYDFGYLTDKIINASFSLEPFKHIYIEDFFTESHLSEILSSPEIIAPVASNDKELIQGLIDKDFRPTDFPGCVTSVRKYIDWHEADKQSSHHSVCEGFGMALRLYRFPTAILNELNTFLTTDDFNRAITEKFELEFKDCVIDGGIQKYLDGYEISPSPDIRRKAATFMVNINPSNESEKMNYHTHYLKLKKTHSYIEEFWKGNKGVDRAWVPWEWTDSIKQQTKNNSIVLFSPSDDTLHGVKASYNHLLTQRTQLHGNLWYKSCSTTRLLEWEQLDLATKGSIVKKSARQKIASMVPDSVKQSLKRAIGTGKQGVGKRNL
ncbi:MAG: hypothetical protein QMC38_15575 [Sinobacterium sp.]